MSALRDRVMEGLEDVIDPCSVTAGAPLSIVDMGLLNELCVDDDGAVRVSMRATSAMCTMIAGIMKVAEERLARVEGVTRVEVQLCSGGIWTEADMTERGRRILAARRERSRVEVAVRPHEWKTRKLRPAAVSEAPRESISN
jgi:metal-sulfur cluster biosynthetic enzyme